ncbi:hypothetical protein CC86DRAFT_411565 [Ophiobolus disseminans]|uniref:Uncharacterized protein n=1 Tax=Ophiobolus disseminans TaxID=1469910 RepID=A0A6A6ZK59_9PLEO|nr:hypothetical protein CC86DRAFT_411565 [Ophiobolus disseminans]
MAKVPVTKKAVGVGTIKAHVKRTGAQQTVMIQRPSVPRIGKRNRENSERIFGRNFPSHRLRFPHTGNITAAEQIVFLTESGLRSRSFPKYSCKNNSVGTAMRGIMREHGHQNWTITGYKSGRFQATKLAPNNLILSGFTLYCEDFPSKISNAEGRIGNVLLEALAIDVTRFPGGDDALDLTHCAIWSVNNPGSGFLYPRDFQWLTAQLDGPPPVLRVNQDHAAFARWKEAKKAWKRAAEKARKRLDNGDKLSHSLMTKETKDGQTTAERVAQAELDGRIKAPIPIATVVRREITVNTARVPKSDADPTAVAVTQYLASFPPPLPPVPLISVGPQPLYISPQSGPSSDPGGAANLDSLSDEDTE